MTTHERSLKRARACFWGSTLLFILFCLAEAGRSIPLASPAASESLRIISYLFGVFAWSLMYTAYDLRRKAL